MFVTYKA